jgi:thiol-disulfide isomerase/thioredoxin
MVGGMSPLVAAATLVALVVVVSGLGLLLRSRAGRLREGSGATVAPADLGGSPPLGARATLVQFSTATCAQCPGTARLLRELAADHPGVVHLEVDLGRHPDVADRFGVLQTPTTLLVDARHRIRARIGGAPRRDALDRELLSVLGGDRVR